MAPVTVDDAASATLEFAGGAIGTLDATRFASGYRNWLGIEAERCSRERAVQSGAAERLDVYLDGDAPDVQGFRTVLVTEATHPYYRYWWPSGHIIGWQNTFVHQAQHLLLACAGLDFRLAERRNLRGRLSRGADRGLDCRVGAYGPAGANGVAIKTAPAGCPAGAGETTVKG